MADTNTLPPPDGTLYVTSCGMLHPRGDGYSAARVAGLLAGQDERIRMLQAERDALQARVDALSVAAQQATDAGYRMASNTPLGNLMPELSRLQSALHDALAREATPSPATVRRLIAADRARIAGLLRGIDMQQTDDSAGWWETSTGAAFGAEVLRKIKDGSTT